jgi:cytochrome c biogenesis protein CcmG/thiol:disulfide interchange protein DsbE
VGFLALLAFGLREAEPRANPGERVPQFELPLLEGGGKTLSSRVLQGRAVVLNFWASWCAPCRDEAPLLERVWRQYRNDGVVFVGVNIRDAASDAKRFVNEFNITYPIVRDESQTLANDLGVFGLPETFFVDHEGRLLATVAKSSQDSGAQTAVFGAISEEQLRTNVEILVRRLAREE